MSNVVKLPIATVDIIPQGLYFSELAGKPLKKLASLLSSFKKARNDKTLKIIFFLEDEYQGIYLRSDDVDEDGDMDIFHDLVDAKTSPYAEKQIVCAKTFPDAILDGDIVKLVVRVNIGGEADTNIDLDNHGSTIARILRQSYARHERMVQTAIHAQHGQYQQEIINNPTHSVSNYITRQEK